MRHDEPTHKNTGSIAGEALVPLSAVIDVLCAAPEVRTELVDDLQDRVNRGGYMSDEKLNLAIYKLLKDTFH